jgi:hypothetical protein
MGRGGGIWTRGAGGGAGGLGRSWAVDTQHGIGVEVSLQPHTEGHHPK